MIQILEEEFINPFGIGYNGLHILCSGEEVVNDLASSILEVYENGKKRWKKIKNNQQSGKILWLLKRFNAKTFKTLTKYVVKCKHVQATVEVNRNILGWLLACSISKERATNIPDALTYPISLSLATGYGNRRETSKSKLIALLVLKVALKDPETDNSVKEIKENATFVIDLIAVIRVMTNLTSTYSRVPKIAIFTIVHHKEKEIVQSKHMLSLWDPIVGMSIV